MMPTRFRFVTVHGLPFRRIVSAPGRLRRWCAAILEVCAVCSAALTLCGILVLWIVALRDGRMPERPIHAASHGPWRHYYRARLWGLPPGCSAHDEFFGSLYPAACFSMRALVYKIIALSLFAFCCSSLALALKPTSRAAIVIAAACLLLCLAFFCTHYWLVD
jgi:hypothetical protein